MSLLRIGSLISCLPHSSEQSEEFLHWPFVCTLQSERLHLGEAEIPVSLQNFIFQWIDSVELVDVLLMLRNGDRSFTTDEIVKELRSSRTSVEGRLKTLGAMGATSIDDAGAFYYNPRSKDLGDLVALLQTEYRMRRSSILELIFSTSKRAKTLADAFVFRPVKSENEESTDPLVVLNKCKGSPRG